MAVDKTKTISRRPSAVIALEILLAGFPIKFADDGQEYHVQDGVLGIKGTRYSTCDMESGDIFLGVDMSVNTFIRLCDKIPFEELYIQSCQMVLTLHNRKERRT